MFSSFRIGSLFGITIRIHFLFVVMMVFALVAAPVMARFLPILFGCVLLHELGHSLVAQRYGIRVLDITLWPLGGMARMSAIPEDPGAEGAIAIAGPAVNFALALIGLPIALFAGPLAPLGQGFVLANVVMGVFNLVPAFPMDGGRLLRAWLARGRDWVTATEQAVRVGRFFALSMVLAWPFLGWNPMLPLIGLFVWVTGGQELLAVRLRHGRPLFGDLGAGGFPFGTGGFPRPPRPPRPPDDDLGRWDDPDDEGPGVRRFRRGFTPQEIERLERYHGRLRPQRRPPA